MIATRVPVEFSVFSHMLSQVQNLQHMSKVIPEIESKKYNGILLPKLFWPTVRKNCSSDWENFLKFEAEGREFAKVLRSLEQFIQTVKGFW